MTQIKDVAGIGAGLGENFPGGFNSHFFSAEAPGGVEISLAGLVGAAATHVEVNVPVNTNDTGSGLGHEVQQFARSYPKEDGGNIEIFDAFQNFCVEGRAKRTYSARVSEPAQESKSCRARAPAAT